jgi:hypothetical protein
MDNNIKNNIYIIDYNISVMNREFRPSQQYISIFGYSSQCLMNSYTKYIEVPISSHHEEKPTHAGNTHSNYIRFIQLQTIFKTALWQHTRRYVSL